MGQVEARLANLGIVLPTPPAPIAAYVPWAKHGTLVSISGQLPMADGVLAVAGKLGAEVDIDRGRQAARLAAINAIAHLRAAAGGDLDRVQQILRLEGFLACAPGFVDQPKVLNGASELFLEAFGEAGRHSRFAVGVAELPLGAAVEISLWATLRDG